MQERKGGKGRGKVKSGSFISDPAGNSLPSPLKKGGGSPSYPLRESDPAGRREGNRGGGGGHFVSLSRW